ncbi:MAG TPA: hypothetical protein DCQ06_09375 [Myxococcales bacterium]|nr:hypothetical protein [Myxococcales bacterium]
MPITLAVLWRRIRDDRSGIASRGEWLTAVVGLTLGFGLLLAQNMAITGEPLTLPYMVWEGRRWIWRLHLGEGPPELRLDPNSVPPLAAQLPRP